MRTRQDQIWMQRALSLAQKGEGYVSPNPLVGCVIVSADGDLIGEGYHERFGREHAEVLAIRNVKEREKLKDATLYVTLEPCAHHGKTPPCADLIADTPFSRVVIAMRDPTDKVNGKGIRKIESAGIRVETGLLQKEAEELNEYWLHLNDFKRPFVTLKIAQTADGYVAAPNGDSKWITCKQSRERVHLWRSRMDAVMVGRRTALHDNPSLTVRHVEGRQPRRVVLDGPFELPRNLNLFSDSHEEKTIIITHNKEKSETGTDPMLRLLTSNYFRGEIVHVDEQDGHVNLQQTLQKLGSMGISSLLVEAGEALSAALIKAELADRLQLFIAPKILGGGARSVAGIGRNRMDDLIPFRSHSWEQVGSDMLLTANL
ncbi:MAG: bifunctional diaminohydroxyphosphoribosylaminopyrimidine deaminase/5-amino-6-(5-phosphoribosylamino)uracil reductase RibD [Balneolaceae bacterium]|nr:MAG: bifunctional diaminohydroxyphosphoribosylaminopyrimidine deaminase/5-amino-6-(5-phosphoribosylamino)uracil reductase RibD [Balneolaceae bacterium]